MAHLAHSVIAFCLEQATQPGFSQIRPTLHAFDDVRIEAVASGFRIGQGQAVAAFGEQVCFDAHAGGPAGLDSISVFSTGSASRSEVMA